METVSPWLPFERRRPDFETKRDIETMAVKLLAKMPAEDVETLNVMATCKHIILALQELDAEWRRVTAACCVTTNPSSTTCIRSSPTCAMASTA